MNVLARTIDGVQELLAVCPCCGEIFRLVEGKFLFPQQRARSCEYLDLVSLEGTVSDAEDRITTAEQRFEERLSARRHELIALGRRRAKRKLKRIDPTFSGRNVDPQDVKVIFDPVEYLVFQGLHSANGVRLVEFISRAPANRQQEAITKSLDKTVRSGNVEFETLRMRDDGSFEIHG